MRALSRIGLVGAALFAMAASAAQPEANPHTLAAATDGHAFSITDGRGHYLALHFLTRTANPTCATFVREYLARAATLAGTNHIFITPDEPAEVKAWSSQFNAGASAIFIDKDGALARDLHVPGGLTIGSLTSNFPATIVFDPEGKELFRHIGKAYDDHLQFAAFSDRLAETSRRPSLADYNLPKDKVLAVEGYDLVAYFAQNKAVKGSAALVSQYRGVTYQFSTAANRTLFAADPEKYLPTYGGWCASAMGAKGTKVEIDPTNFKVKGGRLFLFYKSLFADALKDWNKHEQEWEPAADANWKKLTREEPFQPSK